jgi:hypothetical protein
MAATTKLSIPIQIKVGADARDAYAESLKMILQHVAEFHIAVVDIISEKYNIPVDEIMNTVTSDSRYTNMAVDPKIHRLTSTSNLGTSSEKLKLELNNDKVDKEDSIKKKIKIKKNININPA